MNTTPVHEAHCPNDVYTPLVAVQHGCQCPAVRSWVRAYHKRRACGIPLQLLTRSTAPSRQVRALAANGWSMRAQARELAMAECSLRVIAHQTVDQIRTPTAQRINGLYQRLRDIPGPCERTRNYAADRGWHTPDVWDDYDISDPNSNPDAPDTEVDEVAVDIALSTKGDPAVVAAMRPHDLDAAIRTGLRRGWPKKTLARHLGVTNHVVEKVAVDMRCTRAEEAVAA